MKKIPESTKDIKDILFEQVAKLAELGNSEPEQVRKNTETILSVYHELLRL